MEDTVLYNIRTYTRSVLMHQKKYSFALFLVSLTIAFSGDNPREFPTMDTLIFGGDTLHIHFYGHASLMFEYRELKIYADPVSRYADYASLPEADIILITHEHGDHLDPAAANKISDDQTRIIANAKAAAAFKNALVMKNGDETKLNGITIEAFPAYNTSKGREKYHPKGNGNGYILTLGSIRLYLAGDTEDIPEMRDIKNIDIAFLPANQPYTMTVEQAARAVKLIKPAVFYPYHFSDTDLSPLARELENSGIELRIRGLQ